MRGYRVDYFVSFGSVHIKKNTLNNDDPGSRLIGDSAAYEGHMLERLDRWEVRFCDFIILAQCHLNY
jgi:hypothetical protein